MSEQEIIARLNELVSPELKRYKIMKASELTSINNLVDALHLFCYSTNPLSIYKFVKLLDISTMLKIKSQEISLLS